MPRPLLALIPSALFAVTLHAAGPLSWTNPIVPQRADPQVELHTDGFYYFTATVPEYDHIEVRRAGTLGELSTATSKTIWTKHDHGPMSFHIWAPEIHFLDGKWYVYFAAARVESQWDLHMYVLENPSPNPLEGTWTEKGEIATKFGTGSIDETVFEHRGVRYLAWSQSPPKIKGSRIYIARMNTPWSLASEQVEISRPDHAWEQIGFWVNEGPAFLRKNGRIFLTYSACATDSNYCMGMLTAAENADLLDPKSWTKSPGPVLKTNVAASQYGPGHNCFTTTPGGKTDIIVYHARNYDYAGKDPLGNPDRATRAQIIRWRPDGTPDFGTPVPDGPYSPAPVVK